MAAMNNKNVFDKKTRFFVILSIMSYSIALISFVSIHAGAGLIAKYICMLSIFVGSISVFAGAILKSRNR